MAKEIAELKAEVENLRRKMEALQMAATSSRSSSLGESSSGPKKELGLQTLIPSWGGGEEEEDVDTFLQHVEIVAATGGWSEQEKMLICRSKLTGPAKACIAVHPELLKPSARYQQYTQVLRRRFEGSSTPEQRLVQLTSIGQRPGEEVREFADRCRKLGEQAMPKTQSEEEAAWARGHFERIVTAAFIKGLKPEIRLQLQFDPPTSFQEAINKATRVSEALAEDKTSKDVWAIRRGQSRGEALRRRQCFRCRRGGHFARDCPEGRGAQSERGRGVVSSSSRGMCFVCGSTGHFARECPRRATRAVYTSEVEPSGGAPKAGASTDAPPS
uniref:CCHC-type domain-containing protein n=1 Tax=Rhodnius prolixus TaxID=13249 RepID=T1HA83_RHOPR